MSILDEIIAHKKQEVAGRKAAVSQESLESTFIHRLMAQPFGPSLKRPGEITLIAEIKKASPSKGLIREDFDVKNIARTYTRSGATAISVLTDEKFFDGHAMNLAKARQVSHLPLLRKDFIIDPYQIYEARSLGADAVLLIAAVLTDQEMNQFIEIANNLGMDALVEVHTEEELERVLDTPARVIGINNRNLQTFKTDIETTLRLREKIKDPGIVVVSESGINHRGDVEKLLANEIHAMLVGEALMRDEDINGKIRQLLGHEVEK
jgi:indole-3-glycerol phosphate synthase